MDFFKHHCTHITDGLLGLLHLLDFRGVIGGMDLVLLLMVFLMVETLPKMTGRLCILYSKIPTRINQNTPSFSYILFNSTAVIRLLGIWHQVLLLFQWGLFTRQVQLPQQTYQVGECVDFLDVDEINTVAVQSVVLCLHEVIGFLVLRLSVRLW